MVRWVACKEQQNGNEASLAKGRVCNVAQWIVSCLSKSVCLSFTADDQGDARPFQRATGRAYANCPRSARYGVANCSQRIDAAACRSGSATREFAGETQIKPCS